MHVLGREHRVKAALQRHRLPRAEAAPPSRRGGRLRIGRRQREHEAQRLLRPLGDRAASSTEDGLALLDAEELGHQRACLVWKELLVEPVEQEAQELLRVLLPPRGEEVAVRPHGLHEGVRRGRAPAAAPADAEQRVELGRDLELRGLPLGLRSHLG